MTERKMRTGFAMVPDWVINRVTDGTAMRVYLHLACKYADAERHAFPEMEKLADELEISERTVKRAVATLQVAGAIQVARARQSDGYFGRNLYTLPLDDLASQGTNLSPGHDQQGQVNHGSDMALGSDQPEQRPVPGQNQGTDMAPGWTDLAPGPDQVKQGVSAGGNQGTNLAPPGGDKSGPSKEQPDPKNQPEEPTHVPAAGAAHADESDADLFGNPAVTPSDGVVSIRRKADETFARFWKCYPRKKSKEDARKAWDKAIRKHDPEFLIEAAARLAESRPNLKYTLYPATWLNRGAWDDEPDPVQAVSGDHYVGWHGPADQSEYDEEF